MLKMRFLLLVLCTSLFVVNLKAQSVQHSEFDGIIVPQYMNSGTSTRIATPFYAIVQGLNPGSSYKYYVTFVESADFGTVTTGAGNSLLMHDQEWNFISSPSMTAGNHDTLIPDNGMAEGWFAATNTGNSRFTAGNYVYPLIVLEEIGGPDKKRLALSDSIKVLKYGTTADTLSGTGIYGYSAAIKQHYVALYDGTNPRPLSISHTEDDGETIASSVGYWSSNVEGKNGAWGTIIPNDLDSGVREIRLFDTATIELFSNKSIDGKWGNTNTVNPSGSSTSSLFIDSLYAPLVKPQVNFSAAMGSTSEGDSLYYLIVKKRFVGEDTSRIKINVLGGSAGNGVDYTWDVNQVLNLKVGTSTIDTFILKIKEDNIAEINETILLRIEGINDVEIEGNGQHIINLNDNDTTFYMFKKAIQVGGEGDGPIKVPVHKINGHANSSQKVIVELKSKGYFTFNNEFSFGTGNKVILDFPAGNEIDSAMVTINVVDETQEDLDDSLVLVIRPFSNEHITADSLVTVVVENNDIIPLFTFEKAQIEVIEGDSNLVFKVIRTKKNKNPADIKLSMVQLLSTAFNTYDFLFTPTARLIEVKEGDSDTLEFTVTIKDDMEFESTEQIYFKLEELSNARIGPISNLRIIIKENDHKVYKIDEINAIDANGKLVQTDLDVEVSGVVYGGNMRPLGSPQGFQFTLRDATGGMQVYSPMGNFGYTVKEGDSITVRGVTGQFGGVNQITFIEDIAVHSSNATLKTPSIVTVVEEATESDLVLLENVILVDESEWPLSPLTTNQFKDVRVKNRQGEFIVRIDSDTDVDGTLAPVGYFDVIGLGGQYDFTSPFDSNYFISPRYKSDVIARTQKVLTMEGDSIQVWERYTDSTDDITIRISNITVPTLIEVGIKSSTATNILDYSFNTPYRVTLSPGDTVHTFKINIVDNGTDQTDKVIVLGFENVPYGVILGDDSTYLIRIIDDETTGISEFERSINLKVFPNPSKGNINVTATERLLGAKIQNINGALVYETERNEMNVAHLPKGIYLLQLEFNDNKVVTKRIVIE